MSRSRLLKYINLLIAVLLTAALVIAYWFVWRPLPQTSGAVAAPLAAAASAARDDLGVPHISAGTQDDALFVQGYVTAQDRLFQMDLVRRTAAGELAEVFGPGALASDREARLLRLRRLAEQHCRSLVSEDRRAFAAYARGVNFFLETHRNRLPVEFTLLRYEPRPWTVVDSLLVGLQLFRILTTTWPEDLLRYQALAHGDAEKIKALFPVRTGIEVAPGSNAWALSGARTATGKPLLASDPHLPFSAPSFWYQVHLKAPGLNATGVTVPGLPGVIIGHNDRIAWAVTNLQFDLQDLYIEQLDPATGRYLHQGNGMQATLEREWIAVQGARPVEISTWVTVHGPVVVSQGAVQMVLRWTVAEPGAFSYPILEINRAANWEEFRRALSRMAGPPQNFVYADVDGNIGYQAAGLLPVRRSDEGDFPVDGASGRSEWTGFIPFDELPSVLNPPSGMIVSANQNPFPPDYPYDVSGVFAPGYRARRIQELLKRKTGWRPQEMLEVQTDVYSGFLQFLAVQLVAAYDASRERPRGLAPAVMLLRNWDGRLEANNAPPLIAVLLSQHVTKSVAERAAPGSGATYREWVSAAVVERLLRERPDGWFDDYDSMLLASFADAVEEGKRMQGDDVIRWQYGRYNQLVLAPPVLARVPVAGRYFVLGPAPLSGGYTAVNPSTPRAGPSMRMVADLSDWDRSLQNITIGQSGQALSPHRTDQWEAYLAGKSFPMQFQGVRSENRLEFSPER